ncbi:beta-ketoacyl synthase N-terminal-like domain-containing protein [Kibdelosporangium aridum]|uniref:beta-ketoacyl synthase N-terminal-like domain-containing protein n=1 Tax=Kibdelosporangium aridum TaxID=2030 RepID=UPI0035E9D758
MERTFDQRVVISGMGVVTCLGESVPEFWAGLLAGRSGITNWKNMDKRVECRVAGDLSDFDYHDHLDRVGRGYDAELTKAVKRLLRITPLSGQLAASAAVQAYVDAGLGRVTVDPDRVGHVLAGHNLNTPMITENSRIFADDPEYMAPPAGDGGPGH